MNELNRILVINPNTSEEVTKTIASALSDLSASASIEVKSVPWGPRSVESEADSVVSASAVLETVWNSREDFDGFVVACFDDPGLDACRELVGQPVAGIGESAIIAARDCAERIGVLVVDERVVPRVTTHCARNGLKEDRLVFGSLDGSVVELNSGGLTISSRFSAVANDLVARGAECLMLACAGFSDNTERLAAETGITVMDGNRLGVESVCQQIGDDYRNEALTMPQPFTGERPAMPLWSMKTVSRRRERQRDE